MTVVTYFRTYYSCVRYFYSANEGLVTSQLGEFVQINMNRHLMLATTLKFLKVFFKVFRRHNSSNGLEQAVVVIPKLSHSRNCLSLM